MNNKQKKMRTLPAKLFIAYVSITFLISVAGPMKYVNYKYGRVVVFLVLVLLAFGIGYAGAHKRHIVWWYTPHSFYKKRDEFEKRDRYMQKFVKIAIAIALIACALEFVELLITNPQLLNLETIGTNYANSREKLDSRSYDIATIFRFLTAFFRNISIILGLYYLKNFSILFRLLWIGFMGMLVFVNVVGYGTQKVMGDILVYAIVILGIKTLDKSVKYRRKIIIFCIIGIVAVVTLFTIMQAGRSASIGLTADNFASRSDGLAYYDIENIIFKVLGNELGFGFSSLMTSYLSSGYYGLSLCLQLPFVWCYGIGNSYALSTFANRFWGWENMYYNSYLYRMEETFGRNGLRSWNTIFPWLASDLTFIGVIILFLFVGYIWSVAWDEILKYRNPISILLFANLSLGLIFVPANNQLLSGIDACMSTPFVIVMWLMYHKKFNRKVGQECLSKSYLIDVMKK